MGTRKTGGSAYQLKVTVGRVRPAVWRRLTVPGTVRLDQLHAVLQAALGWKDAHMHEFVFKSKPRLPSRAELQKSRMDLRRLDLAAIRGQHAYSLPEFNLEDAADETAVTLAELVTRARSKFTYVYDFGDDWVHEIVVEKLLPALAEGPARCLAGQGACPPEDSGGPQVYTHMIAALGNPRRRGHAQAREWLGRFDPAKFSLAAADRAVRKVGRIKA